MPYVTQQFVFVCWYLFVSTCLFVCLCDLCAACVVVQQTSSKVRADVTFVTLWA